MPIPRSRRPQPLQQAQTGSLWQPLLAVLALVVVTGCAQPGTQTLATDPATTSTTPPTTVTVGPSDDGRTVNLKVGDWLVVDLRPTTKPSRLSRPWKLQLPQSKVLERVDRDSTLTRVVLTAEVPGTVRLVLVQQSCGPPLQCPLADPSGQSERMHRPLLAVAITIQVQ
jgi:hypothetical protein